jgi:hypothetical protein
MAILTWKKFTFNFRLLPSSVAKASYYHKIASEMKPACAAMSVFIGLDVSSDDLNLTRENIWAFSSNVAGGR